MNDGVNSVRPTRECVRYFAKCIFRVIIYVYTLHGTM